MADSGDTSPQSAAAADDAHHEGSESSSAAATALAAAVHAPPPQQQPPPKVRLMVSYGGRIQPRPHDNQLAYVNGETKILSLERPLRFADFAARLNALVGSAGEFCIKYQLPGEDLDALVSVTSDEDLEHLVIEYDRLHLLRPAPPSSGSGSSRGGANLRLRVFLFPVQAPLPPPPPPPQPAGLLDPKPDRHWFVDAFNNVVPQQAKQETLSVSPPQQLSPPQQKQESVFAQQSSPPPQQRQESVFAQQSSAPPPQQQKQEAVSVLQQQQQQPPLATVQVPAPQQPPVMLTPVSPDYLFGLDNGFVPPPAVKVRDPAGDPPTVRENVPVELPAKNEDRAPNPAAGGDHVAVSPVLSPAEYHQRQIQELEKLQVADNASHQHQPPPLPRNGSDDSLTRAFPPATATPPANAEYYIQKFPEMPPVPPPSSAPPATTYVQVPARYTSVATGAGAEQFYFIQTPHGYYPTSAASAGPNPYPIFVAQPPNAGGNANGSAPSHGNGMSSAYAPAPQVAAYDSNGRPLYYPSMMPQYPAAVNGMPVVGAALGSESTKPVTVKPTVS